MKPLALTPGEPAGIGPDLIIQLAQQQSLDDVVIVADPDLLTERARQLKLPLSISGYPDAEPCSSGASLRVLAAELTTPATAGVLDPDNAHYVLNTLTIAARGCLEGEFSGLVTGPVHKGVINDAGIPFSGHTEFLAELCGGVLPVMMLATESLRVALVTTHLPLREVPDAISAERLNEVLGILHHDLQEHFHISAPRILVCGLNPHAGEDGHLGREEIDIIQPVIEQLNMQGLNLTGPLPADTVFTPRLLATADAVLVMYHDQGLPVLKHSGFGQAVNITLGLPLIRSSVDHGTALELAASGKAETGSLEAALTMARFMTA